MGIPRPITGVLLAALLAATACGAPAPQSSPSASASPPSAEGRCVTSFDTGKSYFPVKQTLKHATNLTLTYAKNYQVLTVKQPAPGANPETYALVRCGTPASQLTGEPAGAVTVETPITTLFSAATTHLPFITDRQQILDPPDYERLTAWDELRATYLGLEPDPLDRTGKGFKHA
jgi:iron complex transport system substrate-binding protein